MQKASRSGRSKQQAIRAESTTLLAHSLSQSQVNIVCTLSFFLYLIRTFEWP